MRLAGSRKRCMQQLAPQRIRNRLIFPAHFGASGIRPMAAALFQAVDKLGYQDIVLDFSGCTAAFPGPMLATVAEVQRRQRTGVEFTHILPKDPNTSSLFEVAGWRHFLDPTECHTRASRASQHLPATQFASNKEQGALVVRMMNLLLSSRSELTRKDLAAVEWVLGEITGNVLTHSRSAVGGFAQLTQYQGHIEIAVCDAGLSIPGTLRPSFPSIQFDKDAVEAALREGVTRDKNEGRGNGLFGTYQLASNTSDGYLHTSSRYAHFGKNPRGVTLKDERVPFCGTLIVAGLGSSIPGELHKALRFSDGVHEPIDWIETCYENSDATENTLVFNLAEEADSLFSRESARFLRERLENILRMNPQHQLILDLRTTPLVSSSFADELFGRLYANLKPIGKERRVAIRGGSKDVQFLVDKGIRDRAND